MTYELKFVADTKEEAEENAREAMKQIDYMRQPHIGSITERPDGKWICTIYYWGLD